MIKDILDYVYDYIRSLLPQNTRLQIGALPIENGVSVAIASGGIERDFIANDKMYITTFVVNSKATKQSDALAMLDDIHTAIGKNSEYFDNDELHFICLRTSSLPTYLGRENDEKYMYGSSIQLTWYLK